MGRWMKVHEDQLTSHVEQDLKLTYVTETFESVFLISYHHKRFRIRTRCIFNTY